DFLELSVGDFDADGVRASIELGLDAKAGRRARRTDQLHDGLMVEERSSAPVLGDVAEHPMFDLVPLRGPRGEVRDADRESGMVGKLFCSSILNNRERYPLLPPASAVIRSSEAFG